MSELQSMGIDEERAFHISQGAVNLSVERRITRLEIMLYLITGLSALNFLGIHFLDGITLFKP